MLCKSGYDVTIFWLDSFGSCLHVDCDGNIYHTRFHPYRDEKGYVYTKLCPNGLEESEWTRVFVDDPPGSWIEAYTAYKQAPPKRSHSEEN